MINRRLTMLALSLAAIALGACGTTPVPLQAEVIEADPSLRRAVAAIMPMITITTDQLEKAKRTGTVSAKLSSLIVIDDRHALGAAHSVIGRPMDDHEDLSVPPRSLIGDRTRVALVVDRGDPYQSDLEEWALVQITDLGDQPLPPPITGIAIPQKGERCLLVGYPHEYLPDRWQYGSPNLNEPTPPDSEWTPPTPLVFEGTIADIYSRSGHIIDLLDIGGPSFGGMSGGGAFVRRDNQWLLIGIIAHDWQSWTDRTIGVTPLPESIRDMIDSRE